MAQTTLDEAVSKAVETEVKTETTEVKAEETKQETKQEEIKTEPTAEERAYQEKVDKAIRLFDSLQDPDIGPGLIKAIAEKAGVIGTQEGKTEKQISKTVVEILKESLGTEYEFLADRLAVGIDKVVKQTVAEQIKPVQVQTNEAIERAVKADVDSAFAKFEAGHKDFKEFEQAMLDLSKEMPYSGDYPMERYLERLYKLVTADKKEANVIKKTVDKINKNAQELRDSSTEVQETRINKGSQLPSLDEAVKAAFRNERLV